MAHSCTDGAVQEIDKNKLIDRHYYTIAERAMKLDPAEMGVDGAKFEKHFNVSWDAVLNSKRAFNARVACRALKMHPPELDTAWKTAFADNRVLKLGGGFYVGAIPIPNKPEKFVYVFNAFYLSMRGVYTASDAAIHYFVVEWNPRELTWSKFRGEVIGATNPAKATPGRRLDFASLF